MVTKKKEVEKVVKKERKIEPTSLGKKRDDLIAGLKPKLLTKSQLKQGGGIVRSRHIAEQGYQAIIDEINEMGLELGLPPVGFDNLRK